jgi:hypothetical protein
MPRAFGSSGKKICCGAIELVETPEFPGFFFTSGKRLHSTGQS